MHSRLVHHRLRVLAPCALASLLVALFSAPVRAGRTIERAPTGIVAFIGTAQRGPLYTPFAVESPDTFTTIFGLDDRTLPSPWLATAVRAFFDNGGRRCHVVRVEDDSLGAIREALAELRAVDEVGAVAAPGIASSEVAQALIVDCRALGDRLAILDAPVGLDVGGVREHRAELAAPEGHGTLYWPWVTVQNAGRTRALPPSGFVAGVWARVDADAGGPWRAPIGEVVGVIGVERSVSDAEQEVLNPEGINVIRDFAAQGVRVWGARTLSSDPEWRYVPVRRFALWTEESIHEGLQWAVFEPNAEPLWAQLRATVGDFLLGLFRDGAFAGAVPDDAFFVRVDRTTMTQADLDAGRTVILVGFAPLQPAEFLVRSIAIERSGPTLDFRRADTNGDGAVDLSDAVSILGFLFLGLPAPGCIASADANGDGAADLSDSVSILSFLFLGGPAPVAPHPGCGPFPARPSDVALGCVAPAGC